MKYVPEPVEEPELSNDFAGYASEELADWCGGVVTWWDGDVVWCDDDESVVRNSPFLLLIMFSLVLRFSGWLILVWSEWPLT